MKPLHGRRARRAQWLEDAAMLELYMGIVDREYHAAAILRAQSEAKRARRLAARRAA